MSLVQIIDTLEGKVIVLYNEKTSRLFYRGEYDIETEQVCFVDCSNYPKLLNKGEWDYDIFDKGFKEDESDIEKKFVLAKEAKFYNL